MRFEVDTLLLSIGLIPNNSMLSSIGAKKGKNKKDVEPSTEDVLAPQSADAPDWDVEAESLFTRVHNEQYVHGRKRLYMTATPKIYGKKPKEQEGLGYAVLYSMDNEQIFGPVFYSLNFDMAVKLGCLVDYKVMILVCDKNDLPTDKPLENFSKTQTARVIGTWKALNKSGVVYKSETCWALICDEFYRRSIGRHINAIVLLILRKPNILKYATASKVHMADRHYQESRKNFFGGDFRALGAQ